MSTLALPSLAFPGPPSVAIETRGGLPTRPPAAAPAGDLVGLVVGVVVAAVAGEPAA
ncbi:hypothetical protein [Intrasporangium calvum]|uniref:Uncharacterized protein n=1 Tax=Intrasporangium calvum (strain ATCC 23552 / DSM 43043 / JCM 3097 / NBRC 12989 / NCIMB 10167 / NRRL B-3866 / 7 KIP) TaxID=710696 RepID=E6S7E0_INTC7|nr:hypothetical protein [Intrasporangium calvum]ADU50103.1 hypothetical protein Intca_3630 [Intrasporangium calvum DSM 43043]